MIPYKASVLNTIADNSADFLIDNNGNLQITGLDPIPVTALRPSGITKLVSKAEQIQKTRLTFTSQNTWDYTFVIDGYSILYGTPMRKVIAFTSVAAASTATISAQATAAVNAISDFTVTATDTSAGIVDLAGHTGNLTLPGKAYGTGPIFTVSESDSNIAVSAPLLVTFSAAPTGGRTATGYVLVPDNGTISTTVNAALVITDPGEGYLAAPTFTFSGGEGASAAATAYIFEGSVIATKFSNGTSYDCRIGVKVSGTPGAIKAKYGYSTQTVNSSGNNMLNLADLTDGYTYTEYNIAYDKVNTGADPYVSDGTGTTMQAFFVYEGSTTATSGCYNILALTSYWGSIENLRKGYKSIIIGAIASNVVTSITTAGAILIVAGGSPALGFVSIGARPGDIIALGAAAPIAADTTGVFLLTNYVDNLNGFVSFGTSTLTAETTTGTGTYKFVQRRPLPQ